MVNWWPVLLILTGCGALERQPFYEKFHLPYDQAHDLFEGQVIVTGDKFANGFFLRLIVQGKEEKHTIKEVGGHAQFHFQDTEYTLKFLGSDDGGYKILVTEVR